MAVYLEFPTQHDTRQGDCVSYTSSAYKPGSLRRELPQTTFDRPGAVWPPVFFIHLRQGMLQIDPNLSGRAEKAPHHYGDRHTDKETI